MGWGRFFLLGDIGQQLDLGDVRQALEHQDRRDRTQEESIQQLWRENQEIKLVATTLVRLLVSQGVVTRDEAAQISAAIEQ